MVAAFFNILSSEETYKTNLVAKGHGQRSDSLQATLHIATVTKHNPGYVMLRYAGLFMIYTIYQILSGSSNNQKMILSKIMKMLENGFFFN